MTEGSGQPPPTADIIGDGGTEVAEEATEEDKKKAKTSKIGRIAVEKAQALINSYKAWIDAPSTRRAPRAPTPKADGTYDENETRAYLKAQRKQADRERKVIRTKISDILLKDFQDEVKAAEAKNSYAEFKPVILLIDGALTALMESFGYQQKTEKHPYPHFDWEKVDAAKFMNAAVEFADAIAKKPAIRDPLLAALQRRFGSMFGDSDNYVPDKVRDTPSGRLSPPQQLMKKKREQFESKWDDRLAVAAAESRTEPATFASRIRVR